MSGGRRIQWLLRGVLIATVVALIAIALVAVRAIAESHSAATSVVRAELDALDEASGLQSLLYQRGFASNYFLTDDPHWLSELDQVKSAFERWLGEMARQAVSSEAAKQTAELAAEYGRYDADRSRAIARFKTGDRADAISMLTAATDRADRLRDMAAKLLRVRRSEVNLELDHAEHAFRQGLIALVLALAAAILVASVAGWVLARRITRPLYDLVLRAESTGVTRVEVNAEDEIEALSEHVSRLAREIESSSLELAEHRLRLMQAEKISALGEMATALAHEVLNPLAGIKTAMQLLTKLELSEVVKETAGAVDHEIDRVDRIARRLISYARPVHPEMRACELPLLVDSALSAVKHEVDLRKLSVSVALDGVGTIEADPDLLEQVMVNLMSNACQAMPEGGALKIQGRREGHWNVIEVRDSGLGLSDEVAGRLFTPFVTTKPGGHGLGLAISQNIIVSQGGKLEARSNAPAVGTTFSIFLPEHA